VAQQQNLEEMHLDELVEMAKKRGIPHATEMRKSELIEALSKGDGGGERGRDGGGREGARSGRESGSDRGHEGTDGVKADWKQKEQNRK
jgi:Rho termination factor, N-terminal domain